MAIAVVQTKSGKNAAAATSLVLTFTSTPTDGNTLFAVIGTLANSSNPVSSITSTGATWSRDNFVKFPGGTHAAGGTSEIWRASKVTSAGSAVTINLFASIICEAEILEVSGLGTPALDKTSTETGEVGIG